MRQPCQIGFANFDVFVSFELNWIKGPSKIVSLPLCSVVKELLYFEQLGVFLMLVHHLATQKDMAQQSQNILQENIEYRKRQM